MSREALRAGPRSLDSGARVPGLVKHCSMMRTKLVGDHLGLASPRQSNFAMSLSTRAVNRASFSRLAKISSQ